MGVKIAIECCIWSQKECMHKVWLTTKASYILHACRCKRRMV